jgi:hypothetical protein
MYIRNKQMNNKKQRYYVIEDRIEIKGKLITKNIRYLGTAKKLLQDLEELDKLRKEKA